MSDEPQHDQSNIPVGQLSKDDHGRHVTSHVYGLAQGDKPALRTNKVPLRNVTYKMTSYLEHR